VHTYEIMTAGARTGRPLRGWSRTLREAKVQAARTNQAVDIWHCRVTAVHRELRGTVFPDGTFVRVQSLHTTPRGFGG